MELPAPPRHALVIVEERPSLDPPGFMRLRRYVLRAHFADGSVSEPFDYDTLDRVRYDAVVVVPHFLGPDGKRHVLLRTALRPPVALRPMDVRPIPEKDSLGLLWEVVAGLVEVEERSPEGLRRCAAREMLEEMGAPVEASDVRELGPPTFPAPGMIGERHFYFHVEIDPARMCTPTEDGSALERQGMIVSLALDDALALARRGELEDAKTELALRRLAEI